MKNNKKGFTLVELVIVVAVMAILVAVAIPAVSTITATAKDQVAESNCQTIESLIKLANAETAAGSESDYEQKLYDAKLGIVTGTYYYDDATGKVTTTTTTDGGTLTATEPESGLEIVFSNPAEAGEDDTCPGVAVSEIE